MNDHLEEDGQFRLRSEDPGDTLEKAEIPAEINELRLEKISQRVTLISIMIPVLIVIVLVITYLDIKKRVVRTEDTGTIEFQKLSADLESRFSSLSVRQARLEDDMAKMIEQTDHSAAAVQVRLQKLQDALTKVQQTALDKKELISTKEELVRQMNGLVDASNQMSEQMAAIANEVKKQMDQLAADLAATGQSLSGLSQKVAEIEKTKIDKPAMDLALRLETLKVASDLKTTIDALQKKVVAMENQMSRTPKTTPVPTAPAPPRAAPDPTSSKPSATEAPASNKAPGNLPGSPIEEQTISR